MILKNKRAIPCELYERTNGNIVEYVEKNITKELCKSIADILSHGGEYIFSMTQAEFSNSSITNSIFCERKVLCDSLVRCKNCEYSEEDGYGLFCNKIGYPIHNNDFCSWAKMRGSDGERKEPKGFVADEWYRDTFKGEEE